MRYISTLCVLLTLSVACKKSADRPASAGTSGSDTSPAADFRNPDGPGFATQAPDSFRARFTTSKGDFVIDRFDGYWGGKEPWARVVRKEIPNDAARVAPHFEGGTMEFEFVKPRFEGGDRPPRKCAVDPG